MIPLRDTRTSGRPPVVTILLILASCYVFYLEATSPDIDAFMARYALIPALINFSDPTTWLPFLTAMFLHGGLFHLASNMWFLWIFGDNVEERFGLWYLPFYIFGGLVGNITQYWLMPESTIPIVGASGAIAAVLGAYFISFPRHTISTLVPIFFFFTLVQLPAFVVLAYWFFTQIFAGTASLTTTVANAGGVAYFAHVGGFLTGVVVALLSSPTNRDAERNAYLTES